MHNGQLGVFYLKEAVMDILFRAEAPITPAKISKRTGIPGDQESGFQYYSSETLPTAKERKSDEKIFTDYQLFWFKR